MSSNVKYDFLHSFQTLKLSRHMMPIPLPFLPDGLGMCWSEYPVGVISDTASSPTIVRLYPCFSYCNYILVVKYIVIDSYCLVAYRMSIRWAVSRGRELLFLILIRFLWSTPRPIKGWWWETSIFGLGILWPLPLCPWCMGIVHIPYTCTCNCNI